MVVNLFRLRCCLLLWLLLTVVGCRTSQPAHTTIPNKDFAYSFNKAPYISPRIIKDLSTWISDNGDQVVVINVSDSQNSNRYFGEPQVRPIKGKNPCVCWKEATVQDSTTNESEFSYQYVGQTSSGLYVLVTADWGGGSGMFVSLLLLRCEYDQGINCDWDNGVVRSGKNRLLIKKVGEIPLGDRWRGDLAVKGNSIFLGKDKGWFAESGGTGGGALSHDRKARVFKIDLE